MSKGQEAMAHIGLCFSKRIFKKIRGFYSTSTNKWANKRVNGGRRRGYRKHVRKITRPDTVRDPIMGYSDPRPLDAGVGARCLSPTGSQSPHPANTREPGNWSVRRGCHSQGYGIARCTLRSAENPDGPDTSSILGPLRVQCGVQITWPAFRACARGVL